MCVPNDNNSFEREVLPGELENDEARASSFHPEPAASALGALGSDTPGPGDVRSGLIRYVSVGCCSSTCISTTQDGLSIDYKFINIATVLSPIA